MPLPASDTMSSKPKTNNRRQPNKKKGGASDAKSQPKRNNNNNKNKGRNNNTKDTKSRENDNNTKKSQPKKVVEEVVVVEKTLDTMDAKELAEECTKITLSAEGTEKELRTRMKRATLLASVCDTATDEKVRAEAVEQLLAPLAKASAMEIFVSLKDINALEVVSTCLALSGKAAGVARGGAVSFLAGLVASAGRSVVPLLLPLVPVLISLEGDKVKDVKLAARAFTESLTNLTSKHATSVLVPELLKSAGAWQANQRRMELVSLQCVKAPACMSLQLPGAVPEAINNIHDLKKGVKKAAAACLADLFKLGANNDVLPLIPKLIAALEDRSLLEECVQTLAGTTFIQEVDLPALALISPILIGGLGAAKTVFTKRSCARIVENMSKLVEDPHHLKVNFFASIHPMLESACKNVADPEARNVCRKACDMLERKSKPHSGSRVHRDVENVKALIISTFAKEFAAEAQPFLTHAAVLANSLAEVQVLDEAEWTTAVLPFLTIVADNDEKAAGVVMAALLARATSDMDGQGEEDEKEADDGAEVLCDCMFSLAFGNKVLLRKTLLKLKRGKSYGLIGKNDSGKTSLMRAIADHRVEGFPAEDELRTVFVETDIQGELSDLSVIEYMMADKLLVSLKISLPDMTAALNKCGFEDGSPANTTTTVGALSGGWKMKLALARAMLLNADILLLDEPTNHLDSYNVKWVEDYLQGLDGVTCVMVSHDSGFLNRICTHIVQIEDYRLRFHTGNLDSFVAKNPDASAFFELKTDKFSFTFPEPGRLAGVKSKGRAIMKMDDVSFTYPGAPSPQLKNVTIQVSLGSRVACVGVNGAGKSTMIKLLTGELEPGTGKVWTHPNMTYGYIAQHAFHHIESHLDKTAVEYILWRYQHGSDREALNKITMVFTQEEKDAMAKPVTFIVLNHDGVELKRTGKIKRFTDARRANRKMACQEYECVIEGSKGSAEGREWISRKVLVKSGWEKALKQIDDRILIREASFDRPLSGANATKHFGMVGLEEEFSTHMRIGALSGGQKVKVVLGAALWNRPHVLILDEPTNYLDRDSLAALAGAIREFEGGVVMITHNSQFCDDLCPQVWHLENNTLNVKGDATWMQMDTKLTEKKANNEDTKDRFGNKIDVKPDMMQMSAKDKRKRKKARAAARKKRIKAGEHPDEISSDEEY